MGKMLDPQNVTTRADRMMKEHLRMFSERFGEYTRDGSRYCFDFNENTTVKLYYETSSKLLTKTFSTVIRITIRQVSMGKSWKAKLNLRGLVKVDKISLKESDQNSADVVSMLNEDGELMSEVYSLFKDFDLQSVTLEYRQEDEELDVTIRPYPGAFIWVKIPPIYYDIRLKPHEINQVYDITGMFLHYFTENTFEETNV